MDGEDVGTTLNSEGAPQLEEGLQLAVVGAALRLVVGHTGVSSATAAKEETDPCGGGVGAKSKGQEVLLGDEQVHVGWCRAAVCTWCKRALTEREAL